MFTVMFAIRAPPAGSRTGSSSTKRPDRASAVRVRFIPAPTCATTCLPPSADHRLALKQTQNAPVLAGAFRSEEQPSELQSLMRNSYAVCFLKKKQQRNN